MRTKIVYLTVCVTLVYWLGGLVGCATSPRDAQNEDMLKEDRPLLDTTPPDDGGNQFQSQATPQKHIALASIQTSVKVTESAESPADAVQTLEPAPPVVLADDSQPSVTGIDRSSWSAISVGPEVGKVQHGYTYFSDRSGMLYTHTTVDLNEGSQATMNAALDDTESHWTDGREWATCLIQPLKFCWDMLTAPYNATYKQPFWTKPAKGE